jgi:hypothetical protein
LSKYPELRTKIITELFGYKSELEKEIQEDKELLQKMVDE